MSDKLEFSIDGIDELIKRFANLDKEGRKRVNRQINVSALEFQRETRKSIVKTSGRYRRYRRGRTDVSKGKKRLHYSSMPGSPPNSDSGKLKDSIKITRSPTIASSYAIVKSTGPGSKYAPFLERGTRKMKARPFWRPMIRQKSALFVGRIRQAINGLI